MMKVRESHDLFFCSFMHCVWRSAYWRTDLWSIWTQMNDLIKPQRRAHVEPVRTTFNTTRTLHRELAALAAQHGISVNQLVDLLLRRYLQQQQIGVR